MPYLGKIKMKVKQTIATAIGIASFYAQIPDVYSATNPAKCTRLVGENCTKKLCPAYCKAASKEASECNCNAMTGLCKTSVTRDDQLSGITQAQLAACKEGQPDAEWKEVTTVEWTDLTAPKTSGANPNEDVRPGEMRVGEATRLAENLVNQECIAVLAPKYCERKEISVCDPVKLCKDRPSELRAQVEAQIMACIAAKRDPIGRKTGRPTYACPSSNLDPATGTALDKTIPWCAMHSPSWREEILYPDPEKAAKKQRYLDAKSELDRKISEKKEAKQSHAELDLELKNLVLEKSLGQLAEEQIESDVCNERTPMKTCRGDVAR